jgi:NAD(P)-dependent dehydrogenase (short-subunit alcohol dehydrogenase family)
LKILQCLSGGNGGLGQAITRWLAAQGVKHIAILSRSPPRTGRARLTIQYLKEQGVQVYNVPVDASNKNALRDALVSLSVSYLFANCLSNSSQTQMFHLFRTRSLQLKESSILQLLYMMSTSVR